MLNISDDFRGDFVFVLGYHANCAPCKSLKFSALCA